MSGTQPQPEPRPEEEIVPTEHEAPAPGVEAPKTEAASRDEAPEDDEPRFESVMGIDRDGARTGSPVIPVLLLTAIILVFVAHAFTLAPPSLRLMATDRVEDLPESGKNLFVVARVGQESELRFRAFDAEGSRRMEGEKEADFLARAAPEAREALKARFVALRERLDKEGLWENKGEAARELDEATTGALVAEIVEVTNCELSLRETSSAFLSAVASAIVHDFPILILDQLHIVWILLLYSLLPGIVGLIYRRSFWPWFLVAFVIMSAIKWWGYDLDNASGRLVAPWTQPLFLIIEIQFLIYLVAFRLRHHSSREDTGAEDRKLGKVLFLFAAALGVWTWSTHWDGAAFIWSSVVTHTFWLKIEVMLILVWFGSLLLTQPVKPLGTRKNIVLCLDGTWNQPGQLDFGYLAETNVYKLFKTLKGEAKNSADYGANQTKIVTDENGYERQIGLYYHGVGNKLENSQIGQVVGGAFGMGASAIVERAYLDVVRSYFSCDRIFLFGFSRGAAIARMVAGAISRRGVPTSLWTLRLFGRHWPVWTSWEKTERIPIAVLGCWDTVGAFGLAKNVFGIPFQKVNLLKDLSVSQNVRRAYHMVALDETRDSFEPTLMDPDPTTPERIVEVWFSGNHANVGGGYATDKLSNVTLDFLLRRVSSGYAWKEGMRPGDESWGIRLSARRKGVPLPPEAPQPVAQEPEGEAVEEPAPRPRVMTIDADPLGRLRHSTGAVYAHAPRSLPLHAVIHDSVFERMQQAVPVYSPDSVIDLTRRLVARRKIIEQEADELSQIRTLGDEECSRIRELSAEKLTLTRWSHYLATRVDGRRMEQRIDPATELAPDTMFHPAPPVPYRYRKVLKREKKAKIWRSG